MGCGCNDRIMSWYDLENHVPKSPFEVISYLELSGIIGDFEYSTDYLGTGYVATPLSYSGIANIEAWESDNGQYVGEAMMWSQQHKMVNVASSVPAELQKMAFLRGGERWKNALEVNVGVDLDWMQISFLENAGTRGDAQGAIPVIRVTGPILSGPQVLNVTTKNSGTVSIGIKTKATASGDIAMWETDWVIV